MPAICDLSQLLREMEPVLADKPCVFVALPQGTNLTAALQLPISEIHALIQEQEGWTLIVDQTVADLRQWPYQSAFRRITLQVHSSLDAVGLTAAVAQQLAACDISANVVAAYHHDHIYVPASRAHDALKALQELTGQRKSV